MRVTEKSLGSNNGNELIVFLDRNTIKEMHGFCDTAELCQRKPSVFAVRKCSILLRITGVETITITAIFGNFPVGLLAVLMLCNCFAEGCHTKLI